MTTTDGPARVFGPRAEFINIAINIVFLVIGLSVYLCGIRTMSTERQIFYLAANVLFLNSIHGGFTYAMLIFIPEFRGLAKIQVQGRFLKNMRYWQVWLIFLIFEATFVTYGFLPKLFPTALTQMIPPNVVLRFYLIFSTFHSLRQFYGFSSIYNYKIKIRNKLSQFINEIKLNRVFEIEKYLFLSLIFVVCLRAATKDFIAQNSYLAHGLQIFSFVLFGLLIYNAMSVAWAINSNKILYLTRLLTICASPLSPLLGATWQGLHGTEYLLLTHKIVIEKYRLDRRKIIYFWSIAMALGLTGLFLNFNNPDFAFRRLYPIEPGNRLIPVFLAFTIVGQSHSMMHFFIDGFLFKFSNPEIENKIGPLVVKN